MTEPDYHTTHGLLADLCLALLDARDRMEAAPSGTKDVADIACDPYRLELSKDYSAGLVLLQRVNRQARVLTEKINRDIIDYDDQD